MKRPVKVTYTLTVTKTVEVEMHATPPAPYSAEEWREQQILDEGDKLGDAVEAADWKYEIPAAADVEALGL